MGKLDDLVRLSHRYGLDPEWILAGGGNTSFKDATGLYVKASGTSLGTIDETGFCTIDRDRLMRIWERSYPEDADAREAAVLADLMAARGEGQKGRPSVETLLHGLFPQSYAVHSHPTIVNGLTCGRDGEAAFARLFKDIAIWVPFVEPGYLLARAVKAEAEAFRSRAGAFPNLMFMQNHGLLVAGESAAEIDRLSALVISRLEAQIVRRPCLAAKAVDATAISRGAKAIKDLAGEGSTVLFRADGEILARAASEAAFAPLSLPFSPDHIVYAGHEFLCVDGLDSLPAGWLGYADRNGQAPRIVLVRETGAFAISGNGAAAVNAMLLFVDACKVAAYAESFGGASHMSPAMVHFIRNWEVERFRAAVSQGGKP